MIISDKEIISNIRDCYILFGKVKLVAMLLNQYQHLL